MPAPFATLEARSTAAVFRHLANAQAQAITRYSELVAFPVIFDNGHAAQLSGFADATQPTAQAKSADVVDLVQGCQVGINADTWSVVDMQPDGTGMTTLILRKS